MIDMASVGALLGALKTAGDIAKTVSDLRNGKAFNAEVIKLQAVILSAQESAFSTQRD